MNQKSTKHGPKIVPKSVQNRPKIGPKSVQNRSRIVPKPATEPTSLSNPFLVRFWSHFGSNLGPSWGPSCGHVGQKIDFWRVWRAPDNEHDFQHPSGPSWDRFWDDFWSQNRPKIGPEAVSRASEQKSKNLQKTIGFSMFFGVRGGRKSIKNRSKSHLK